MILDIITFTLLCALLLLLILWDIECVTLDKMEGKEYGKVDFSRVASWAAAVYKRIHLPNVCRSQSGAEAKA